MSVYSIKDEMAYLNDYIDRKNRELESTRFGYFVLKPVDGGNTQGSVKELPQIQTLGNSNSIPSESDNSSPHIDAVPPHIDGGSPSTSKVLQYIDGVANRMFTSHHYGGLSSYGRRYPSAPLSKRPSKALDIIDPTTGEKLPI